MNKKLVLTTTVFAAFAATTFASDALILAQVGGGNLDTALGKVMGIVYKLAYVFAVVGIFGGAYKLMKGDTDQGKLALVGAAVMALAGFFVQQIFSAAGVPVNIQIQ